MKLCLCAALIVSAAGCAEYAVCSLVFPAGCEVSGELKDLIVSILEKDPKKRLTLQEIRVSHSVHIGVSRLSSSSSSTAVLTDPLRLSVDLLRVIRG